MILDSNNQRPKIDYPCEWNYKVIGTNIEGMIKAIEIAVAGIEHEISSSNVSSKGNYFSINLKVFVTSEVIRDIIFAKIENYLY
jgi:putative lipoic acid-binding regulatory protein